MVLAAGTAWGAEFSGRSSTQFLWYNNEFTENRVFEAVEYLRLGINKIDSAGKLSFFGYGRGAQTIGHDYDDTARLYYLYADYRDLFDKVDLRLGRQFVTNSAGNAIIDGLQVDLKNIGPVAFTAFGGRDVVYGLDGEIGYGWNSDLGISAYLSGFRKTDLEVSWLRKWEKSETARDIIGGSFKQYLFGLSKVYGNARYDLLSEAVVEGQIGLKVFPVSNLTLTGEFYQSYPTFDATSLYAVFAVDKYREGVFRADYNLNDVVAINAGYNRQWYGDGADADVYHVGTTIAPTDHLKVSLEYDKRQGYNGDHDGFMCDVDYEITKNAQVAGGITYDVYQREALTTSTTTTHYDEIARRYWIGGKYRIAKNMAFSGRIQDDVNARYSENVSGRVTFDYDF
jgi:hypothetical protein